MKYYVIDLETSGLKLSYHEITELSILRCEDLVQGVWLFNIKNPKRFSPDALEKTGQDLIKIANREFYIEDKIEEINAFIEEDKATPDERVMIAHNSQFDRNGVEMNWKKNGYKFPANYWMDTKELARKYITKVLNLKKRSLGLGKLLRFFDIYHETNFHTAEVDVRNTFRMWKFLNKKGINNMEFVKISPTLIEEDLKKLRKNDDGVINDTFEEIADDKDEDINELW